MSVERQCFAGAVKPSLSTNKLWGICVKSREFIFYVRVGGHNNMLSPVNESPHIFVGDTKRLSPNSFSLQDQFRRRKSFATFQIVKGSKASGLDSGTSTGFIFEHRTT